MKGRSSFSVMTEVYGTPTETWKHQLERASGISQQKTLPGRRKPHSMVFKAINRDPDIQQVFVLDLFVKQYYG